MIGFLAFIGNSEFCNRLLARKTPSLSRNGFNEVKGFNRGSSEEPRIAAISFGNNSVCILLIQQIRAFSRSRVVIRGLSGRGFFHVRKR